MSLTTLTEFFGWCTAINLAFLIFTSLMIVVCRSWVTSIHSKLFGMSESELSGAYFGYLANYKIAFIALSLVPYLALTMMS